MATYDHSIEGFPSPGELFNLQDRTCDLVWREGHTRLPVNPIGERGGLVVAEQGAVAAISLEASRLERLVPEAIATLGITSKLQIIAISPYLSPDTTLPHEYAREVGYEVAQDESSPYADVGYYIRGNDRPTVRSIVTREPRMSAYTDPTEDPMGVIRLVREIAEEGVSGRDRITMTEYRALSAVLGACMIHGRELFTPEDRPF